MMGLIQGVPTKRDAELAAEATRESWQALLDRLSALAQGKSLPERQSLRNDVLGAIHVHMARRSYENRVNWQIERDEIFKAVQDGSADPAAVLDRLRAMLTKPETPTAPIQPLAKTIVEGGHVEPGPSGKLDPDVVRKFGSPEQKAAIEKAPSEPTRSMGSASIWVESRQPDYAIHRVSGKWKGDSHEAHKLIELDARENYPFGHREIKVNPDLTFSYVGHTD